MHMIIRSDSRIFRGRTCKLVIGFCWIGGLLLGMYAASVAGDTLFLTMLGDVSTVSIPGLLIASLPFLLTAFAVFLPHPGFLIPLALWRSFSYGFCAYGLAVVYHGAAWLTRLLLMFGQNATAPLLMWLWLRKCDFPDTVRPGELAACGIAAALIGIVDHCMVSPFAASLL